ncbi:MAG: hypothetical protein ACREBU_00795 [Nitrososphaera sp.]
MNIFSTRQLYTEKLFLKWFRDICKDREWYFQHIETGQTARGYPDIEIHFGDGQSCKIELKMNDAKLRISQQHWWATAYRFKIRSCIVRYLDVVDRFQLIMPGDIYKVGLGYRGNLEKIIPTATYNRLDAENLIEDIRKIASGNLKTIS